MHWVTKPGHLAPRGGPDRRRQPARSCGRSPGVRNFGVPHRPGAARRGGRRASSSARTGSASTRRPTTTRRVAAIQEVVDGYPGCSANVQTYLKERIREVLTGVERRHRGPHLRPRPRRPAREGGRGRGGSGADRRASSDAASRAADRGPADRGRGRPGRRPSATGIKPGDVRRAAVHARWPARRSATSSATARRTTSRSGARPSRASSVDRHREPADRHADRRHGPPRRRRRRCGSRPTPNSIQPRGPVPADRRRRQRRRAATWARSAHDVEDALDEDRLPARLPRRAARRVRGAPGRPEPPAAASRSAPRSGSSCSCSGVVQQLRGWRCWRSSPCRSALVGGVGRPPIWPAASSRSARWSGSSPCSGSPPATGS